MATSWKSTKQGYGWLGVSLHWLMLALLGWLTLNAKGLPVVWFGVELPVLAGANDTLVKTFKEIHEAGATAGYFVAGLHAAAALFHHYALRDNTLRLMLLRR